MAGGILWFVAQKIESVEKKEDKKPRRQRPIKWKEKQFETKV